MSLVIIDNVSAPQFADLRLKLQRQSQSVVTPKTETSGSIEGHGVTATYAYTPSTQVLSVEILRKPFYVPVAAIQHGIEQALGRAC